jgi:hypothetical protein
MSGRQLDQWDSTAIFERWDHLDALEQAQGGLTAEQEAERQQLGHEYNNRFVELAGPMSSVPMNDRPARPTMSVGEWRALPTGYKTVHREFGPMVLRLDPATGATVSQAVDLQFGPLEGEAAAFEETAEAGRADQEAGQEMER